MAVSPSPAGSRSIGERFREGGWYFVLVIASAGILSPVPFAHAASRLRQRALWAWAGLYAAVAIVVIALSPDTDEAGRPVDSGAADDVFGVVALALIVSACLHLRPVRRRVYGLPDPPPVPPVAPVHSSDPAVAAALAARTRRDEARRLAAADPLLARELRIGRPDLPRDYDDGGLVDLNSAPAEVIADLCGIDPGIARRIVEARTTAGVPFAHVDDAFAYTDIPVALWDRIRDRAVILTR
ncbi:ComEA family DNA-binding protein [Pseudonocardia bannensis]|uniref:Helix-hairpin-helix domain-containing protein n=1 Tax=Pseudonocardia bannensis TaxID=630973 RepID=A0A848DC21_9PSEU|nr:helix-hairpin-helix domain-containing protein [Pseudonocardia bannensis]NMH90171.1 helix-hairpin-helix domain-containing protein [Pseudonocardia bannensis]